jgi:hypothetical protein
MPMWPKRLLERYTRLEDGRVSIDVSVERVEDLYNDFERSVPFMKKDLNDEFADYLAESGREIGKTSFVVRLNLDRFPDESLMERVRRSIRSYFQYRTEMETRELRKIVETSIWLGAGGFLLLAVDITLNRLYADTAGVVGGILLEGLTIAAWVALWESLANLLVNWGPHRRDIRLYRRLSEAGILFRETFSKTRPA